MPNYVDNVVRIEGGIGDKDLFTDGNFDFNKLIPMPKDLDINSGSANDIGLCMLYMEARENVKKGIDTTKNVIKMQKIKESYSICSPEFYEDKVKQITDPIEKKNIYELGEKSLNNYIKYGSRTWYEWCCEHWDTKWNAMETNVTDNEISFVTAWSPPYKVIEALSKVYQGCRVECEYSGEIDHPGRFVCLNGKIVEDVTFPDEYDEEEE